MTVHRFLVFAYTLYVTGVLTNDVGFKHPPVFSLLGQKTTLPCSIAGVVDWYHRPVGQVYNAIYNGVHLADSSRYRLEEKSNLLVITKTRFEDAGVYRCRLIKPNGKTEAVQLGNETYAELIVLKSKLSCETNFTAASILEENNRVWITCSLEYHGNPNATIDCSTDSSSSDGSSMSADVYTTGNLSATNTRSVTTSVDVTVNSNLNGKNFTCFSNFWKDDVTETETKKKTKISNYDHFWTSDKLNVVFKPKNLRLEPDRESYTIGSEIECVSDGNPSSTFQWYNVISVKSEIRIADSKLTIDPPVFAEGTYNCRCVASNILGQTDKIFIIKVKENGVGMLVYIVPTSIFVLLLVVVIVVLVVKNRNIRRKFQTNAEKMNALCENAAYNQTVQPQYDEIDETLFTNDRPSQMIMMDPSTTLLRIRYDVPGGAQMASFPPEQPYATAPYLDLSNDAVVPSLGAIYAALQVTNEPTPGNDTTSVIGTTSETGTTSDIGTTSETGTTSDIGTTSENGRPTQMAHYENASVRVDVE